jgi:hypothetical protein
MGIDPKPHTDDVCRNDYRTFRSPADILLALWPSVRRRAYLVVWVLLPSFAFSLSGILLGPGAAHRAAALLMVGLNIVALWLAWGSPAAAVANDEHAA